MKCKYRVRWFSSKGALLVLVWTILVVVGCTSSLHIIGNSTAHRCCTVVHLCSDELLVADLGGTGLG